MTHCSPWPIMWFCNELKHRSSFQIWLNQIKFSSLSWLLTFYSSCKSSSEGMQISCLDRLFLKTLQIIFNINLGQTLFAFSNTSQKKKRLPNYVFFILLLENISLPLGILFPTTDFFFLQPNTFPHVETVKKKNAVSLKVVCVHPETFWELCV